MGITSDLRTKPESKKVVGTITSGDESMSKKDPKKSETANTEEQVEAMTVVDGTDSKQEEPSNDSGKFRRFQDAWHLSSSNTSCVIILVCL